MRIKVTKPKEGKVDLVVDDLRGATGMKEGEYGVLLADLPARSRALVDRWRSRKDAIRNARKQPIV